MSGSKKTKNTGKELAKVPTGIVGLDEITLGGLPEGRPTLVVGNAGCGKTVFAMRFLVNGALHYNEPGVFVSFEENADELLKNFGSVGMGLDQLLHKRKLIIDHVHIERSQIQETGEFDLQGLFVRLEHAVRSIGAKRIVLDTIEALFSGFTNEAILRAELRRLFGWIKSKGLSAVITAERGGDTTLSRHGLEEYVADCVVLLDHLVINRIATRRLRIVKYRGSAHGTNEYPFLINKSGISVLPITSLGLTHKACTDHVSSGVPALDALLDDGKGYFRGSTILVSGSPGSGKTSMAAHFIHAACRRGEKALFFSFEESPDQIVRNMSSIGIDLGQWIKAGLLEIVSDRSSVYGLENHLVAIHDVVERVKPRVLVVDPISNFTLVGDFAEIKSMLSRLIDYIKMNAMTALFTDLTPSVNYQDNQAGISSLTDTWVIVSNSIVQDVRKRQIGIVKSRGMKHSDEIRSFKISEQGLTIGNGKKIEAASATREEVRHGF